MMQPSRSDCLTFGSLFTGIGGIDLGLERAGMTCKWQVEISEYARQVLAKHWPDVKRYKDVRDVGAGNLEPVDLICGGFPCQDVSVAGKRAGLEGKRSTLWGEFARIICEIRPRWVLAENVPGLLSSDNGRFFGNILRDLAASGYDAEWNVLSAAAVGAPHRRDRVFIVAYPQLFQEWSEQAGANSGSTGTKAHHRETARNEFTDGGQDLANPNSMRQQQQARIFIQERRGISHCSEDVAHSTGGRERVNSQSTEKGWPQFEPKQPSQWAVEPNVGRVVNGVPYRMDRLKCLGNAVVPQCAEYVGRLIVDTTRVRRDNDIS